MSSPDSAFEMNPDAPAARASSMSSRRRSSEKIATRSTSGSAMSVRSAGSAIPDPTVCVVQRDVDRSVDDRISDNEAVAHLQTIRIAPEKARNALDDQLIIVDGGDTNR